MTEKEAKQEASRIRDETNLITEPAEIGCGEWAVRTREMLTSRVPKSGTPYTGSWDYHGSLDQTKKFGRR